MSKPETAEKACHLFHRRVRHHSYCFCWLCQILVIKLKNWEFASPFESLKIIVSKLLLYVEIRFHLTKTQMRAILFAFMLFFINDKEASGAPNEDIVQNHLT